MSRTAFIHSKTSKPIDQSSLFTITVFRYDWATLKHFPGNMQPTQYSSSSPPPQPVKSSDGKVADDNLHTRRFILQNQSRDQVNAMSSAPKGPSATKSAAQAPRLSPGTRSGSSRDIQLKVATTGKAPRVQPGQNQLIRLGFRASSSPPRPPVGQTPAKSTATKARGPGYYSLEAPRSRPFESAQARRSPPTPKKLVHFLESLKKNDNNNYNTLKQQESPASRATASPETPKRTSSPARGTTESPGTPKSSGRKQPGKLVANMSEVQLYITYSRAYKEIDAKMANNPPKKDELQEKWIRKRKDMKLTREQNHRFKEFYKQIQEEDKERAKNRKRAEEEKKFAQRSATSTRQDSGSAGKRDMSATTKTGPPRVMDVEVYDNLDRDDVDDDTD